MGQVAILFPGQGAQFPGMGRELAACSPAAAEIFRQADALRPGTSEQCFSGSEEALRETKNTQPCLFTVELAAAAALQEAGIFPHMAAGFSLGELSALTFAQVVDFSTSFRLVCRRGALMQAAAERYPASMAAVVRLDNETVEAICSQLEDAYPVNYNCPGQVTVAAKAASMPALSAAVKAVGGRAIPLKVGGGFHSPFMNQAAAEFGALLKKTAFQAPQIPVYSDVTGLPYGDVKPLLARQICAPVRWEAIIRHMIARGVDTFLEAGSGHTLAGFVSKIDPNVRTFSVQNQESLEIVISEVKICSMERQP